MKLKQVNNTYFLRFEKGEEFIETIKKFCSDNKIEAGFFTGVGAVSEVDLGLFDINEKKYYAKTLKDMFEITSLSGNLSTMNDAPYIHAHATVSNKDLETFGGHLSRAVISATLELVVVSEN
ncbi:MAG: DNA-binding protein, partial [Rickettsiales bacterium]|nr:DNA-binding protein [Rickettsiales bacterium]